MFLVVLGMTYFSFVFIGESFNPFMVANTLVQRRRQLLARTVATIVLFSGVTAIFAGSVNNSGVAYQALVFVCLFLVMVIPGVFRYRKRTSIL